jgi:hypothetical protein
MDKGIAIKLSLFALLLLAIFACEKAPRSVEDLSHKIRTVTYSIEDEIKIARIELDGEFGSDEAYYFFRVSKEMYKILRKVTAYFPEDLQKVHFVLKVRLQNVYGISSEKVVLEVPFSMTEVKKIRFYNSSSWDVLNKSDQIRFAHPIGRNIVRSFCDDGKYQKRAAQFCLASIVSPVSQTVTLRKHSAPLP